MMVLPLESISFSKLMLNGIEQGGELAQTLIALGKGIGGLALLFVLIYYLLALLDGGKFQMKMLWPMCVFFLVCNFSWVSTPVASFLAQMSEAVSSATQKEVNDLYAPATSMFGKFMSEYESAQSENHRSAEKFIADKYGIGKSANADQDVGATDNADDKKESKGLIGNMFDSVLDSLHKWLAQMKADALSRLAYDSSDLYTSFKFSCIGILAAVLNFLSQCFVFVYTALGASLMAILVAFGPVTFAFAILPGMHRNITSWFIRLVQFSLWGPIVSLIRYFFANSFLAMMRTNDTTAGLFLIGMIVGQLIALVSVPSIASMIVEGASGGISLSGGVRSIVNPVQSLGGFIAGRMSKKATEKFNQDEASRDQQQLDTLREINSKL